MGFRSPEILLPRLRKTPKSALENNDKLLESNDLGSDIDSVIAAKANYSVDELKINSVVNVTADKTIDEDVLYEITPDGGFNVAAGVTLTINTPIKAGRYQCFYGDGDVLFNGVSVAYPEWFGASTTATDNSSAFNKLIGALGYLVVPVGTWDIQNPIQIPAATDGIGYKWYGFGKERSIINCVGMSGKNGIELATGTQQVRIDMSDFKVGGDADHAINVEVASETYQVSQSSFSNMHLESTDSAFIANEMFSCNLTNLHFFSTTGHGIEISGGNSMVLQNCYAHQCGDGKAGYRIQQGATLIACNGLDNVDHATQYWGRFGDTANNISYSVQLIGCNAEDWGTNAIILENFGNMRVERTSFLSRATGTYESAIKAIDGSDHNVEFDQSSSVVSKGATQTAASEILSQNSLFAIVYGAGSNGATAFSNYYNIGQSLLYQNPVIFSGATGFARVGLRVTDFKADISTSFFAPTLTTWTANSATFSVAGFNLVQTANTVATDITNATGNTYDGAELRLLIKDNNTVVKHSIGGTGKFINKTGADITPATGDVLVYIYNSGQWVEF